MTDVVVAHTDIYDSRAAGAALGYKIAEGMRDCPDVVLLFAAPTYNHATLLQALKHSCHPHILLGCSSAGEFTREVHGTGLACAVALSSHEMQFTALIGHGLQGSQMQAAREIAAQLRGASDSAYRFHSALVLADGLSGCIEELINDITTLTGGAYQLFGAAAGDNAQFRYTPVFYGTTVVSDAVVVLEICSHKALGIGACHGWRPASAALQVTAAKGMLLKSLDDEPAVEAFRTHAASTDQVFDLKRSGLFLLHNLIGIDAGFGFKLRALRSVEVDGAILCATEIPVGATVYIMASNTQSAIYATESATRMALQNLYGTKPAVALFFDCVATRLKMGQEFGFELEAIDRLLTPTRYIGCNSHGQIVRAEGQFSGFHNSTAVVCLIPE